MRAISGKNQRGAASGLGRSVEGAARPVPGRQRDREPGRRHPPALRGRSRLARSSPESLTVRSRGSLRIGSSPPDPRSSGPTIHVGLRGNQTALPKGHGITDRSQRRIAPSDRDGPERLFGLRRNGCSTSPESADYPPKRLHNLLLSVSWRGRAAAPSRRHGVLEAAGFAQDAPVGEVRPGGDGEEKFFADAGLPGGEVDVADEASWSGPDSTTEWAENGTRLAG